MEEVGPSQETQFSLSPFVLGTEQMSQGEGKAVTSYIWLWNLESWQTIGRWGC